MSSNIIPEKSYLNFLSDLKSKIQKARVKAAIAVNRELIILYWEIGHGILQRQGKEGWGAKVIDRLSADLKKVFVYHHNKSFQLVSKNSLTSMF